MGSLNKTALFGVVEIPPQVDAHGRGRLQLATIWTDRADRQRFERLEVVWSQESMDWSKAQWKALRKGQWAFVDGALEVQEGRDENGRRTSTTRLVAQDVREVRESEQAAVREALGRLPGRHLGLPNDSVSVLVGHLGRDPDIRFTESGQAVANFSVATNRPGRKGEEEHTDWHRVVLWADEDKLKGYRKGQAVYVEGRVQIREWTNKEGAKQVSTEITANSIKVIGRETMTPGQRAGFEGRIWKALGQLPSHPSPPELDREPEFQRNRDGSPIDAQYERGDDRYERDR